MLQYHKGFQYNCLLQYHVPGILTMITGPVWHSHFAALLFRNVRELLNSQINGENPATISNHLSAIRAIILQAIEPSKIEYFYRRRLFQFKELPNRKVFQKMCLSNLFLSNCIVFNLMNGKKLDPSACCRHALNFPQLQKKFIILVFGSRACPVLMISRLNIF